MGAWAEFAVRRLLQREMAVAKNPKHPEFSGFHVLVDSKTSAGGAVRASRFAKGVGELLRDQAYTMRQHRLFAVEITTQTAGDTKGKMADDNRGGEEKDEISKKKAKTSAQEDGGE